MSGLHLVAEDERGARLVSALVQDAILAPADIRFDGERRHVAVTLSRFRWEALAGGPTRVRSLLVVRNVARAERLRWPAGADALALLVVRTGEGAVRLDFAGGAALRLRADPLRLALEDMSEPWRVRHAPHHDVPRLG